jgi:hypothetical protein
MRAEEPLVNFAPLLVEVMHRGKRLLDPEPLSVAAERLRADLATLPPAARSLRRPAAPEVNVSSQLGQLTSEVAAAHRRARQA